ncbi:nuclear transport factor 2 family protein [Actinomadura decatromicini]|uniref:SnoaL-like domain-containing protein n=1 Tax=Actinomadura decatromicini TaxID=2604572 RepID=A0A5D3FMA4_9ACTN|nr:nuclear transport factor 2 family protein [Actinomadura decatromicini]TYK49441.1 hypothetical protein FXF68_16950 [Actinomadura decatromicini]
MPGFDTTQDLLGPIVVELGEELTATARFDARVTHVLTETVDAPIWVIGCHYSIGLKQENGEWRACSSRVRVMYEEGNPALETAARERVQLSSL